MHPTCKPIGERAKLLYFPTGLIRFRREVEKDLEEFIALTNEKPSIGQKMGGRGRTREGN